MKKQNKTLISILMICFMVFTIIPSFLIIPSAIQTTISFDTVDDQEPEPETSQFVQRTIRVAIYDEPNVNPASVSYEQGAMTNNYQNITIAGVTTTDYAQDHPSFLLELELR